MTDYIVWTTTPFISSSILPNKAGNLSCDKQPNWIQIAVLPSPPTDAPLICDAYNTCTGVYIYETKDGIYFTRNPWANEPEWVKVSDD